MLVTDAAAFVCAVVVHEWSLELYGTNGPNPNEHLVQANKTARILDKKPDKACELPQGSLDDVMHQEKQVRIAVSVTRM